MTSAEKISVQRIFPRRGRAAPVREEIGSSGNVHMVPTYIEYATYPGTSLPRGLHSPAGPPRRLSSRLNILDHHSYIQGVFSLIDSLHELVLPRGFNRISPDSAIFLSVLWAVRSFKEPSITVLSPL